MTLDLPPDQWVVSWRGDLWRSYAPPPTPPAPLQSVIRRRPGKFTLKRGEVKRRVLAAFHGQMASSSQIVERTGLTPNQVEQAIARLKATKQIVCVHQHRVSGYLHYRPA